MTKLIISSVAAVLVVALSSAYAGGAGCPAGKSADGAGCASVWSALKVTPEQQAKIDALKEECDRTGCTKEAGAKFMSGLDEILTPEQLAQLKTHCEKEAKAGACPMKAAQGKKDPKS